MLGDLLGVLLTRGTVVRWQPLEGRSVKENSTKTHLSHRIYVNAERAVLRQRAVNHRGRGTLSLKEVKILTDK